MPSSAIEAANSVAIHEFFTDGIIDEDSPTPCDKVTLKISIRVSVAISLYAILL